VDYLSTPADGPADVLNSPSTVSHLDAAAPGRDLSSSATPIVDSSFDPGPVLFVLPDLSQAHIPARSQQDDQTNLRDHLLQGQIVDFGDSVAMLATYLIREKKGFDVPLSSEANYTRLLEGPATFIGGLDNGWTMRVLEPVTLPYGTTRQHPGELLLNRPGELTPSTSVFASKQASKIGVFPLQG